MFATGTANNLLPISELRVFQERAEDIVGCELKPLCDFIASQFSRERCKYALTLEDFFKAGQQWAQWQTNQRERAVFGSDAGHDMEGFERHDEEAELNYFSPDQEELDEERERLREHGHNVYQLKLERHVDKVREMFRAIAEREMGGTGESSSEEEQDEARISIPRLSRVFKDLAYIIGFVVISFENYFVGSDEEKQKTRKSVVSRAMKFMWREIHDEHAKEVGAARKMERKNAGGAKMERKSTLVAAEPEGAKSEAGAPEATAAPSGKGTPSVKSNAAGAQEPAPPSPKSTKTAKTGKTNKTEKEQE